MDVFFDLQTMAGIKRKGGEGAGYWETIEPRTVRSLRNKLVMAN